MPISGDWKNLKTIIEKWNMKARAEDTEVENVLDKFELSGMNENKGKIILFMY